MYIYIYIYKGRKQIVTTKYSLPLQVEVVGHCTFCISRHCLHKTILFYTFLIYSY